MAYGISKRCGRLDTEKLVFFFFFGLMSWQAPASTTASSDTSLATILAWNICLNYIVKRELKKLGRPNPSVPS